VGTIFVSNLMHFTVLNTNEFIRRCMISEQRNSLAD